MAEVTAHPSLQEREFFPERCQFPLKSGFTPRPEEKQADYRKPVTSLSLECEHRKRVQENVPYTFYPSVESRMWAEAAKLPPPFPGRPDDNYNFNVWRNFKAAFGLQLPPNRPDPEQLEVLAACYPVNIPKPSHMQEHTFARYVETSNLFKDEAKRRIVIRQLKDEDRQYKQMALLAATRDPPLDERGAILPPQGYKRYAPLMLTPGVAGENAGPPALPAPLAADVQVDMFGNIVRRRERPKLWKLSYRSTNPKYQEAMRYSTFVREGQPPVMFPTLMPPPAR